MPKAEKGSLKDLGKRIKAKGLQKLKFYCQQCHKQCRDANGFNCHMQSESHLRQMKIFSEQAGKYMDQYSKDFEKSFLETLRRRHGTVQVRANTVYQEVIQDRDHVHMNATVWASLTDFCKYLGRTSKCVVEETVDRGWCVTYIERNAAVLEQQVAAEKRQAAQAQAEVELQERMDRQRVEAAKALDRIGGTRETTATALEADAPALHLELKTKADRKGPKGSSQVKSVFGEDDEEDEMEEGPPSIPLPPALPSKGSANKEKASKKRPRENDVKDIKNKERDQPDEPTTWLYRGIVVRIISQDYKGGIHFRKKALVERLQGTTGAELTLLDDLDNPDAPVLRLDQKDLETVIPKKSGDRVRLLRGKHRGEKGVVVDLDKAKYRATLKLKRDGTILERVDYEDFSSLA